MRRFFSFFLLILRIEVEKVTFPTENFANKNPTESTLIPIRRKYRKALVSRKKKKHI